MTCGYPRAAPAAWQLAASPHRTTLARIAYVRLGHRRVSLADLIAFAWSAPVRDLATRMQMSDVGLKKLLRAHGVSGPPQGYWNRVHAGRPVSEPPAAPARRPGEKPYIHVDGRFVDLPEAPLPSSAGPFASAKVP